MNFALFHQADILYGVLTGLNKGAFIYSSAKPLIGEFEDLMLILNRQEFPAAMERCVKKLCRLADHAAHEIEDLKPELPQTEVFRVTDALREEAFRAGLAAKDFSVGFLQRHFHIGFNAAYRLQSILICNRKIKRAFLVGDVLCKG